MRTFRPRRSRQRWSRRIAIVLAAASPLALTGLPPSTPTAAAETDLAVDLGALESDGELFWEGRVTDSIARPGFPEDCALPAAQCFEYTFSTDGGGDRLRVAFTDPSVSEFFEVHLYDPAGQLVGTRSPNWSGELFVADPAAGTWRVLVIGTIAEDAPFFLRAKLEVDDKSKRKPGRVVDELPNLRLLPPFELTFEAPATLFGPGIDTRTSGSPSCSPTETVEGARHRCLRFALGPANVGDGTLELRYTPGATPIGSSPITQVIHRSDGSTRMRSSGTAEYHHTHAHYHHVGFGTLELFRVDDLDAGEATYVGTGPKQGYCIGQYLILDWEAFDNDPIGSISTCETRRDTPAQGAEMWLAPGWSDVYGWGLDGNYVELPEDAADGVYLLRSTTDPGNDILETDETDNTSYALMQITGDDVQLLERGYGAGPWDPDHEVVEDPRLYDEADTRWVPFSDEL